MYEDLSLKFICTNKIAKENYCGKFSVYSCKILRILRACYFIIVL